MSTEPTATPAPQHVTISGAIASPSHECHYQAILAAIMAGLQAATPLIITLIPPKAAAALQIGEALEPTVVQVVQTIETTQP